MSLLMIYVDMDSTVQWLFYMLKHVDIFLCALIYQLIPLYRYISSKDFVIPYDHTYCGAFHAATGQCLYRILFICYLYTDSLHSIHSLVCCTLPTK